VGSSPSRGVKQGGCQRRARRPRPRRSQKTLGFQVVARTSATTRGPAPRSRRRAC